MMAVQEQPRQKRYQSYLLRLWQTSDEGEDVWRASLEAPGTGERHGFASLDDLFNFLQGQVGQAEPRYEEKAEGDL